MPLTDCVLPPHAPQTLWLLTCPTAHNPTHPSRAGALARRPPVPRQRRHPRRRRRRRRGASAAPPAGPSPLAAQRSRALRRPQARRVGRGSTAARETTALSEEDIIGSRSKRNNKCRRGRQRLVVVQMRPCARLLLLCEDALESGEEARPLPRVDDGFGGCGASQAGSEGIRQRHTLGTRERAHSGWDSTREGWRPRRTGDKGAHVPFVRVLPLRQSQAELQRRRK